MLQTYQGSEPYIFISYAHADSDQVIPIIESFMDRGFRVWYDDSIEAGKEWREDIADRIVSCNVMIVFLSPNYVNSRNCKREVLFAEAEEKNMFVAQLEEATLTPGMRMTLGSIQHKYAWKYPNMEAFIAELCSAQIVQPCLGTAVRKSDPGVKTPAPAPQSTFEHLLIDAQFGDAQAQLQVGDAYYNGEGVEKDLAQAAYWYEKAAQQGLAEAQHKWAWALCYGEGTTKNSEEAVQWWERAAEQDWAKAMNALGKCYAKGEGVDQSDVSAYSYFARAALRNDIHALHNLSKVYENGIGDIGLEKNPEMAAQCLELAKRLGDVKSQSERG